MPNPTDHLVEEFAKLGFDYHDLAPSLLEIQPALSVYQTKVFDSRTTRPTDYFHFAFELWRKKPDDPLKITCLSVGLIGRGLNTRKRIEASQKFNMGGNPSPSPQPRQNPGRRRKR